MAGELVKKIMDANEEQLNAELCRLMCQQECVPYMHTVMVMENEVQEVLSDGR